MEKIELGKCWLCKVMHDKDDKQMVVIHTDGKAYCKKHYKILKEYERETKGKNKEEILHDLVKEGVRLSNKYALS